MKHLSTPVIVLTAASAALLPLVGSAQETASDAQAVVAAPVVHFAELSRKTVQLGDHKMTLVRVRPPQLPKAPPPPAPNPLTAEQQAAMERLERKEYVSLTLSATVYLNDKQPITELRWRDETGEKEYRAFSNADFRYLTQLNQLETETAVYSWFPFVDAYQLSDWIHEPKSPIPAGLDFNPSEVEYFVEAEAKDSGGQEGILAGLDYLHAYYKINYNLLKADYEKREADNEARERELREHPPVKPDTVMRYWPINSRPGSR